MHEDIRIAYTPIGPSTNFSAGDIPNEGHHIP